MPISSDSALSSYASGGLAMPARMEMVAAAMAHLRRFAVAHGFPESSWHDVELAATEAVNNAIEHGARSDPSQEIQLDWKWCGTAITFGVQDPGRFFPDAHEEGSLPEDPLSERGRGTFLMRRLARAVRHSDLSPGHRLELEFEAGGAPQMAEDSPAAVEETLRLMTEDLSSAYENLSALFRLSESLVATGSFASFLQKALDELPRLVGCDGIHLAFIRNNQFDGFISHGKIPAGIADPAGIPPAATQGLAAFQAVETTIEDPSLLAPSDPLRQSPGPLFCCPMALSNRVLGVMTLFLAPGKEYFTAGQLRLTRTFADVLAIALSSDLMQQERNQQQRMVRELEIAAELQTRLLPKTFPATPVWQSHGICQSARQAGGDFFDIQQLDDHRVVATVADVMGKGISAAMVGTIFRTIFHGCLASAESPGEMLARMAELAYREISELEVFITCQVVLFDGSDPTRPHIVVSGAGHCPLLVVAPDGGIESAAPNGFPLGMFENSTYSEATIALPPGARVILMTDGLPESGNPDGRMLGQEGLEELILRHHALPCSDFCGMLIEEIDRFSLGHEASDDRTLLVVDHRITPPPP